MEIIAHISQDSGYYNQQLNTIKNKIEKKPKET